MNMKNELLKNKIIDSIANKTVSDNLIYLSIAIIKHNNYLIDKKEQSKYGINIKYLFKAAVDNGISKDNIGRKVNSITVESYANCISLRQALKISGICNTGDYIYDKNYLPDAVCGFVSDDEYASMLKDFGFSLEDNISKNNDDDIIIDNTTDKNKFSKKKDMFLKRHCEIIDTLTPYIWDNKRVLLTRQVEEVFGMSQGMLLRRFYKFRENFELEKDYHLLNGMELKRFYELNNLESYAATTLYVWTQNGVSLFAQLSNSKKYLNLYQYMVKKYFEKQELIETYTPSINDIQITSETESNNQQQSLNQPEQPESLKTPIEIALGLDADGMTTARKLYEFLKMDESHYSRWVKSNITENPFAEENVDYFYSPSMASKQKRGNFAQDFKLTANFAKKLSMQGKTERAEQAREYFIRVEDKLKEVVLNKDGVNDSILKTKKKYQTDNVKCYTSSTPIPKIKDSLGIVKVKKPNDWFHNNNHKIEKILDAFGWEHSYLYHIILKTIGQEYDLKAAECIYEELGISVEYAMDIVEYFDVLSQAATEILNKMVNGVINAN